MSYTTYPVLPAVRAGLVGNSVVFVTAVLVVVLRCVARYVAGARLGWDDYLMLVAVPQGLGLLVCSGIWSTAGIGYRVADIGDNFQFVFSIITPFETLFDASVLTVKLSVLIFYYRVFTGRRMRLATRITTVLVSIWGLANFVQTLLVCHLSSSGRWVLVNVESCPAFSSSTIAAGFFNCNTNIVISILPLYTVWTLRRTSVSTRLYLSLVFLLSSVVTAVSIYRISVLVRSNGHGDPLQNLAVSTFLTTLEVNLSILTNSLPMLLPLYSYWRYKRVWREAEDEYVSRLGWSAASGSSSGSSSSRNKAAAEQERGGLRVVEGVVNGVPLETIYGVSNVHFSARAETGAAAASRSSKARGRRGGAASAPAGSARRGAGRRREHDDDDDDDGDDEECNNFSDAESTRGLPRHAQAIQIQTKWTVTEEIVDKEYK